MEIATFESLSREEILRIFEQRHLDVTDMYNLTRDELLHVYRTFALPLSRRPPTQRHHNKHVSFHVRQKERCDRDCDDEQMSNTLEITAMDIELMPRIDDDGNIKTTSPISIGEKRRPSQEDYVADNYQYHLSRATKRIKINGCSE